MRSTLDLLPGRRSLIPIQFGPSGRVLYGVFDPGATPRRRVGALILNPWGWEALRAHRTLRTLATRLGEAGLDVVRFDFSGTGDSYGVLEEASMDLWIEDAVSALDELLETAEVRSAVLVGLRLGALVAGELAARRPTEAGRIVLWEPPSSGREAVEWIRGAPPVKREAFELTDRFESSLRSRDDRWRGAFRGQALVLAGDPDRTQLPFARSVTRVRVDPTESPCWVEDRGRGAGRLPTALLDRIVGWVSS